MGRNQYPLNDRITACQRELLQLKNDEEYLKAGANAEAILPKSDLGLPGSMVALVVPRGELRSFLVKINEHLAHREAHGRRVASFERVLGTLADGYPGRRQETQITAMLVGARVLAKHNANEIKRSVHVIDEMLK